MGALASLLMHLCLQNTSGWGGGEGERDAAAGAPWAGGDGEQAGLGQRQSVPAGRVARSDRPAGAAEGNNGAASGFSPALSQGSPVLGLWGSGTAFPALHILEPLLPTEACQNLYRDLRVPTQLTSTHLLGHYEIVSIIKNKLQLSEGAGGDG